MIVESALAPREPVRAQVRVSSLDCAVGGSAAPVEQHGMEARL